MASDGYHRGYVSFAHFLLYSIPKLKALFVIVFKPRLCRTCLSRKLGYNEVIFIFVTNFSISFTTNFVEVKSCIQKMIFEKKE